MKPTMVLMWGSSISHVVRANGTPPLGTTARRGFRGSRGVSGDMTVWHPLSWSTKDHGSCTIKSNPRAAPYQCGSLLEMLGLRSVKQRRIHHQLPPFTFNERHQVDEVHMKNPFPLPILALI
jgi:hypothetical protein